MLIFCWDNKTCDMYNWGPCIVINNCSVKATFTTMTQPQKKKQKSLIFTCDNGIP